MTYYLGNSTRSVITVRVRYSKKLVEDFPIQPGEEKVFEDRQYQLIEGDKTQCDVLTRLNIRHVNDSLADTNVEIQELIDAAILSMGRGLPVSLLPDLTNQKGVSVEISSADHVHNVPTDEPVAIIPDASTQLGGAASFSRSDHQHAIAADAAVTLDATTTNTEGGSTSFSRADHTHNVSTGAPASIQPDFPNQEGTGSALARANHIHRIVTEAPITNLTADTVNAEGIALTFSRSDHVHNIDTGVVSTIGVGNTEGTSANLARADHVHDHGQQTQADLHAVATQSANGFMSSADKTKIDGRKAGIVASGSFLGNPKKATVTFSSAWPDTNYTITIIGIDSRSWTYETKTTGGFTISANANQALTGEVSWQAIRVGE